MSDVALVESWGRNLSHRKIYNHDFSGKDLKGYDMRGSMFCLCNFDDADMSEVDATSSEFAGSTFRRTKLYRTNMRNAVLANTVFEPSDAFGLTVTLTCQTFHGMHVSNVWWEAWMCFLLMLSPEKIDGFDPRDIIIKAVGRPAYIEMMRRFKERDF
jgi:hypothetical protein